MSLEQNGQAPDQGPTPAPMLEAPEAKPAPFMERVRNLIGAARADYRESDSKLQNVAAGGGVVALQGFDRLRASVIFVPTIAAQVLESTHSPEQAAAAGGVAFAAWCASVGGVTTEALHQYPSAVEETKRNFPKAVDFFSEALPGVDLPTPEERRGTSLPRRIGRRALTGLKRGYTVTGIGTVAYVSTSTFSGKSKPETHKLNMHATADGTAAVGAVIYGVGQGIVQLAESNPALAEHIQNTASDIKLWYGVAAAMMAGQFVSSRYRQFRQGRQEKAEQEAQTPEQRTEPTE